MYGTYTNQPPPPPYPMADQMSMNQNFMPQNVMYDPSRGLVPLPPNYNDGVNMNDVNNYYSLAASPEQLNVIDQPQPTESNFVCANAPVSNTPTPPIEIKVDFKYPEDQTTTNMSISLIDYSFNDLNRDIAALIGASKVDSFTGKTANIPNIEDNITDSFQNFSLEDNK